MSRYYYQAAIIIYAVQLFLMAIVVQGDLAAVFNLFPRDSVFLQYLPGFISFVLCFASVFAIRKIYVSGLRAQRQEIEILKMNNIIEQNNIFRQHRHDLYNHLAVISGLAQLGQLDKLRNYLASYLNDYNKSIISVNTGVKELDVILYAKINEASNQGIEVNYQWDEALECAPHLVIKLVTMLSNALDNAIQACALAGRQKIIGIIISGDLSDYIFQVSNSINPEITNLERNLQIDGFTSKPGSVRGEGVSIIRRTVKKLRGNMSYRVEDSCCNLIIEIPRLVLEGRA